MAVTGPRVREKMTALTVKALAKIVGLHGDGGGLYLRVATPTARAWLLRYQLAGKAREMGLGRYPDVTLAAARQMAQDARSAIATGIDPIATRKAAKARQVAQAVTFRDSAEAYIEKHAPGWRSDKHATQWRVTLGTYAYPVIGAVPVGDVTVEHVTRILDPLWAKKTETASRVRSRIELVLAYAKAEGLRTGDNPASWRDGLKFRYPSRKKVAPVKHHAALPYAELPAFMTRLRDQSGLAAQAMRFTFLTAARTGEVINARWSEFDMQAGTWTIPGQRMKSGRDHRVPLSQATLAVLREVEPLRNDARGGWVFPGLQPGQPLSNMAMLALLKRMGLGGKITVHGTARSGFKDWAHEETNFPTEAIELALAHVVGDDVEIAYRRGDMLNKRRDLAEAWGRFLTDQSSAGVVTVDQTVRSFHLSII
jgi:integrase